MIVVMKSAAKLGVESTGKADKKKKAKILS